MSLDIITILLFLLPGMFALLVECSISGYSGKPKSNLEVTAAGIIMSIPVFALSLGLIEVLWCCYRGTWLPIHSISDMNVWLNSFKHLLLYLASSGLSACLIGILWATQDNRNSILIKAINGLRKIMDKAYLSGHSSVWDCLLNNQEEVVVSVKTKDGTEIKGYLLQYSQSGDNPREITLFGFDNVENKYKGYFDKPKIAYYNFQTDTLLTFYDMDLVKEYANSLNPASSLAEAAVAADQVRHAKFDIRQWASALPLFRRNRR
jgi:hypothetical protein